MARYTKAIVAIVAAVASYLVARFAGHAPLDDAAWHNVLFAASGAVTVFTAKNVPDGPATKAVMAAFAAIFAAVNDLFASGVAAPEWWQLAPLIAGTIGVYSLPNKGAPPAAA